MLHENKYTTDRYSYWHQAESEPLYFPTALCHGSTLFRKRTYIIHNHKTQMLGIAFGGHISSSNVSDSEIIASLPPLYPEWLGDRTFQETHKVRFPYIIGEMANGISSAKMVITAAQQGILAFFGAAGLSIPTISENIQHIRQTLGDELSWGSNLIHTPHEHQHEERLVELYIQNAVLRVSASAFMQISPALVQYACTGLHEENGFIRRKHYLFAKISRPELAAQFMSPPPDKILEALVKSGKITQVEANLAKKLPLSEDITVEADSAGHTDNQVAPSIMSIILEMRNRIQKQYAFVAPIRVGAAGGIGSPSGAAAAFAMGAAYILTGTINQACVESSLAPTAKKMLESVKIGDTTMCAAADMFENGIKLQVLKRGSMYAVRANWLYEIYKNNSSITSLPATVLNRLEKEIFRKPLSIVWEETQKFWQNRDPRQLLKAEKDEKHKMALIFRSYLGLSSRWAIAGLNERQIDYQIWCGPAMAAFNHWVQGSFLAHLENRQVGQVALNILEGAAQILRAGQLRSFGLAIPAEAFAYSPRRLAMRTSPLNQKEQVLHG